MQFTATTTEYQSVKTRSRVEIPGKRILEFLLKTKGFELERNKIRSGLLKRHLSGCGEGIRGSGVRKQVVPVSLLGRAGCSQGELGGGHPGL